MKQDLKRRAHPRQKMPPERFLAVQTGIICAAVFFIIGIIFGLKIGKVSSSNSTGGGVASDHGEGSQSVSGISEGNSGSGTASINNWNHLERASDSERQQHYQGAADRANNSGARYHVSPKDIQEGVEAFYK